VATACATRARAFGATYAAHRFAGCHLCARIADTAAILDIGARGSSRRRYVPLVVAVTVQILCSPDLNRFFAIVLHSTFTHLMLSQLTNSEVPAFQFGHKLPHPPEKCMKKFKLLGWLQYVSQMI
jgi:hypothetical protein